MKYILPVLYLCLTSCQNSNSDDFNQIVQDDSLATDIEVSAEMAMEVIEQMPSPLETSAIIKKTGIPYNSNILNPFANLNNYNTNSKKAVNFGIYGTDLGYINMYNSSQDAIHYLEAITSLSQDLNISHFFNFDLLGKLATNDHNLDSLMFISTRSFEQINEHLATSKRGDLGALIMAGGWIEAMYLACEVNKKTDSESLREKIGDQKVSLNSLVTLMNAYKSNALVEDIRKELLQLQNIFQQIEVKEGTKEPKLVEEDGIPMYQDKKVLTVVVSDAQLGQIRAIIVNLRAKLVK